jgi:hypothetical membrane protein
MSLPGHVGEEVSRRQAGRPRAVTILAAVSTAGPVLFWGLLLLAQSLHPGYNPWEDSVSRLIFGPSGWVQTANFCLLTVFTAAFGAAVYLYIAKSFIGQLGSMFLVLIGLAQLLTAIFRVDVNPSGPNSLAYSIHKSIFMVSAGAFPFGALLLLPSLWSDRRWRSFTYPTVAAAASALALELVWLLSRNTSPHLIDPWFGVYERILLSIPLAWMILISARLFFLSRR